MNKFDAILIITELLLCVTAILVMLLLVLHL